MKKHLQILMYKHSFPNNNSDFWSANKQSKNEYCRA